MNFRGSKVSGDVGLDIYIYIHGSFGIWGAILVARLGERYPGSHSLNLGWFRDIRDLGPSRNTRNGPVLISEIPGCLVSCEVSDPRCYNPKTSFHPRFCSPRWFCHIRSR
jgi:hypothetical protein